MNQPTQPNSPKNGPTMPAQANAKPGPPKTGADSLLDGAEQLLSKDNLSKVYDELPESVQDFGSEVVSRFNKLSTTEKVVGGVLLTLGIRYLTSGKKRKAKKSKKSVDALQELMLFVNDRIAGYKRAVEESQNPQHTSLYQSWVDQSQRFANELNVYLRQQGGSRETGTTIKGKLYRGWMDAKATVTGADAKAILESNIYGEKWAIKAYKEALKKKLTGKIRQTVKDQFKKSKETYVKLKSLRSAE